MLAMSKKPDVESLAVKRGHDQTAPWERQLADEIVRLYPHVHPALVFREQLRDGLTETMRHRSELRVAEPAERRRWVLIAGAAVGSMVSLAGLAAYFVCSRLTNRAQHAASQ